MCRQVCACAWLWRSEVNIRYLPQSLSPLFFWDRDLRSTRSTLIWLDWLVNKLQEYFHFCLHSSGVVGFLPHLVSIHMLGTKLRFSFWCSKPFTHRGSSSVPRINSSYISFILLNLNMFYNKKRSIGRQRILFFLLLC